MKQIIRWRLFRIWLGSGRIFHLSWLEAEERVLRILLRKWFLASTWPGNGVSRILIKELVYGVLLTLVKQKREYQWFCKGSGSRLSLYLIEAEKEVIKDYVQEVVQGCHSIYSKQERRLSKILYKKWFKAFTWLGLK